ncbi:MAG TPA: sigma-70 family RNA polymerase sigma factor [Epulopiscium sp.]|nr:sigma-70 family RNA polymerase sigma factor [Candidatus Epulonipiscium sp.]
MDKNDFAARVEEIKGKLYRVAYLYLGNQASALEAVDEAVYKGFRARKKLREHRYFDTWMTRILINECNKELNRRKRVYPSDYLPVQGIEEYEYDTLPLKEAIGRLPKKLRVVIVMRYFSDYTLAQTAESLKIPQGTVVTRQRQALKLLKLELLEEEESCG